jgi:hypothetical protein
MELAMTRFRTVDARKLGNRPLILPGCSLMLNIDIVDFSKGYLS